MSKFDGLSAEKDRAREIKQIMAEIGFSVLKSQCLDRRIAELSTIQTEVDRWEKNRDPMSKVLDCA